jgi:pentatricopeptide repeat protein
MSGSLELGEELHAEIAAGRDDLLENDAVLGNAVVDMYAKCGALAKARSVFDRLPTKNAIAWTSLISGYARHGLCAEALSCYREMVMVHQTRPDMVAVSSVLKACGELKLIEVGEVIHAELGKQAPSIRLQTSLVDMYIGCGALEKAQRAFDHIHEPDVVLWTLLIGGYANSGSGDEALGLFWSMLERGLAPDTLAFACVLKACSISIGSIGKGEWLHACCRNRSLPGHRHRTRLGNALVDMYAKNGILAEAKQAFDELTMPDIVSWNALLTGYAQFGRCREALALFYSLMAHGAAPNEATFLIALSACSHGGLVEEGEICFDRMAGACGVKPAAGHYACLVDLFGRAGRFDKAVVAVEGALPLDRVSSWVSLLSSCRRWVKIELGRWAFQHLLRLDAKHAGAYVCIDNLYAMSCMGECEE